MTNTTDAAALAADLLRHNDVATTRFVLSSVCDDAAALLRAQAAHIAELEAAAAWASSTEQALRRRVAELEQEAAAMQRRIEDMASEMKVFMDAMQRHPGAP